MNHRGDLYSALITGGSRLLLLKNGVVLAQSGPLFDEAAPSASTSPAARGASAPTSSTAGVDSRDAVTGSTAAHIRAVAICAFTDDVLRVAVATAAAELFLFEFDDAGLLWRDTHDASYWRTAADGLDSDGGAATAAAAVQSSSASAASSRLLAMHGRGSHFPTSSASAPAGRPSGAAAPTRPRDAEATALSGGATGRLRWRRVTLRLTPASATARQGGGGDGGAAGLPAPRYRGAPSSTLCTGAARAATAAAAAVPVRIAAATHPPVVRSMEFVSEDTLCVVLDAEAALVVLGNSSSSSPATASAMAAPSSSPLSSGWVPDRVVWRSMGAYRCLAVCRVNHHVALALGHATMVVFPARTYTADGRGPFSSPASPSVIDGRRLSTAASTAASSFFATNPHSTAHAGGGGGIDGAESRTSSVVPTPAFSPTSHPLTGPRGGFPSASPLPPAAPGGASAGGLYTTLAERGLTTSVGIHRITDMRWHRVATHTLLCVTCTHPQEEMSSCLMLYTVQSLSSTRRYTNVMEEHADGGWGLCRGGYEGDGMDTVGGSSLSGRAIENIVQLVPAGVIALTYTPAARTPAVAPPRSGTAATPTWPAAPTLMAATHPFLPGDAGFSDSSLHPTLPTAATSPEAAALCVSVGASTTWGGAPPPSVAEMHTSLVPNFSRSAEANSLGSRMEFVHVEGDGTVRTSSYSFGRQKHASFAKQRAVGLACTALLQPLLQSFGSLVKVTVLPPWRTRPMELGHDTGKQPCAVELLLSASRRYRMVLRFTSGVLMAVMVDLSAAVYRVESFLALGAAPLLSLRTIASLPPLPEDAEEAGKCDQSPGAAGRGGASGGGASTIVVAGLLGFPTPALLPLPAGLPPRRLLRASPSFLEAGEAELDDSGGLGGAAGGAAALSSSRSASANSSLCHPPTIRIVPASDAAASAAAAAGPARTVWGVVLLQVEPADLQARALTVAPLCEVRVPGVSDLVAEADSGEGGGAPAAAAPAASSPDCASSAVTEEDVVAFMVRRCPDKLRFLPALLKAAQQDAGRLLTQLTAKYGPLEDATDAAPAKPAAASTMTASDAASVESARAAPIRQSSPSALVGGCISVAGEVQLLVRESAGCESAPGAAAPACAAETAAALIRLRPPCLESLAPVHRLLAAGVCQIPFEAAVAEYVTVPAAARQSWAARRPAATAGAKHLDEDAAKLAHDVQAAFRACERVASATAAQTSAVQCEVVQLDAAAAASAGGGAAAQTCVRVRCPLSPATTLSDASGAPAARQGIRLHPGVRPSDVLAARGTLLVKNDVVVGVCCRGAEKGEGDADSVLYLYGRPAVQTLAARAESGATAAAAAATFALEATLTGVSAFFLSASGEVVVLRRDGAAAGGGPCFERWLRCFPDEEGQQLSGVGGPAGGRDSNGYTYVQDLTWCPPCGSRGGEGGKPDAVTALTMMDVEGAWEANVVGLSAIDAVAKLVSSSCCGGSGGPTTRPVLYALSDNSFIRVRQLPLHCSSTPLELGSSSSSAGAARTTAMPQYHPDAVMQLIGMARWTVLEEVLACVATAARAVMAATEPATAVAETTVTGLQPAVMTFSLTPEELARRLCTSSVARGFCDRPQVIPSEEMLRRVTPARVRVAQLQRAAAVESESDAKGNASLGGGGTTASSSATARLYDLSSTCGPLVAELTELLPQVTLSGLRSHEQLKLLCILQALRDTLPVSRSVDEAAARHLFYSRYMSLGRRLRLNISETAHSSGQTAGSSPIPINSVLHFEVGRTAARTVSTASFLWAAMSDSQSTLVSLLFDRAGAMFVDGGGAAAATAAATVSAAGGASFSSSLPAAPGGGDGRGLAGVAAGEMTWEQVEQAGVAFWLRSAVELRAMAERVARQQYQATKELTACALMYVTARKVGTLAALAKAQNNARLQAFFSRDFARDEHHRAAASANAYAAVSKNMPQYGAAFFLLAGDVQSAVQVLLQRCRNPSLALFVLRASVDDGVAGAGVAGAWDQSGHAGAAQTPLEWYAAQRTVEAASCGALDMWEQTCLSWLDVASPRESPEVTVQRRISALQRVAAHPTAHPEALCALRYARDCVPALAYRGDQFLSAAREVVCLLRLGRFCVAHRLYLNGYLHYRDAEGLLYGLRASASAGNGGGAAQGGQAATAAAGLGALRSAAPKMAADFNAGTLTFKGFDSDSDDEGGVPPNTAGAAAGTPAASAAAAAFTLSLEAASAAEAEVLYAYRRTGALDDTSVTAESRALSAQDETLETAASRSDPCEELLRRMLLSFAAASSFMMTSSVAAAAAAVMGHGAADTGSGSVGGGGGGVGAAAASVSSRDGDDGGSTRRAHESFQLLLTSLLRLLLPAPVHGAEGAGVEAARPRGSRDAVPPSPPKPLLDCAAVGAAPPLSAGWCALCVPLLHFLLSRVALQNANYIVLLALQEIPVSTEGVLEAVEAASAAAQDAHATPFTPRASPSSLQEVQDSPLLRPLRAFFHLVGTHVRRHYQAACRAEEERLGGYAGAARASRSAGGQQLRSGRAGRVWRVPGEQGDDGVDALSETEGEGEGEDGHVHRNMFDALLAAAAAAEEARSRAGAGAHGSGAYLKDDSAGGGSGAAPLQLTDAAQVSLLLSCCQSQLQLRLLEHLKSLARAELDAAVVTPTTKRAMDAGILYSEPLSAAAQAALLRRRLLLCTLLLDLTSQWAALSEECTLRMYTAQPLHVPGPLTDPNGVFLEVQHVLKHMRAVLVAALDAPATALVEAAAPCSPSAQSAASASTWVADNTLMMLDLCTTQLEVFWTLPAPALAQCRHLAAPTKAAIALLQESTRPHASASALLQRLLRPATDAVDPLVDPTRAPAPVKSGGAPNTTASTAASSPLSAGPSGFWGLTTRSTTAAASDTGDAHAEVEARGTPTELYCPALSYMQLAWLRRHHTHALLRWLLLSITLDRGSSSTGAAPARPLSTDRLILAHQSHSVTGVGFDASSCDSVVWTTEAGTSVGHGFRELLAGDNEEALWSYATERNLATAAFTLGLTAQQSRLRLATEHAGQPHTPTIIAAVAAKAVLESRPRCAVAASALPSSHPHLPFFVARHRDGHLDLYPFASQECVASFCCSVRHGQHGGAAALTGGTGGGASAARGWGPAGSTLVTTSGVVARLGRTERHAVTPVAFSPNGYIIATGLSDGSVAGWRFAAAAVESLPAFFFPQLFAPFGVRACGFCGDRSSLLVVVGVTREPHTDRRGSVSGGWGTPASSPATASTLSSSFPHVSDAFTSSFAVAPLSPTNVPPLAAAQLASPSSTTLSYDVGELVGEVLVLDTMLDAGAVTARCALPFIPAFAVYLTPLRAVLIVSADGMLATYAVGTGRLAVLGTVPVTAVLRSLLGPALGADDSNSAASSPLRAGGSGGAAAGASGDAVRITCLARSAYDPLVALGTSNGLVLLLHLRSLSAAMARAERRLRDEGEDVFVYYPPAADSGVAATGVKRKGASAHGRTGGGGGSGGAVASATLRAAAEVPAPAAGAEFLARLPNESVLQEATCMQVAPHVHARSAIEDLVFSPSMLLAGLRDGKVMATSLIARATRTRLTSGSAIPSNLLECA